MLRVLKDISAKMDLMIGEMQISNDLMKQLTEQLEIISLPPDMIKWAQEKQ